MIETNFSLTEILAYAKDAFEYNLTDMSGFPFDKSTASLSGVGSSVVPETLQSNVLLLHEFFFGDDGYSPSSTVTEISTEIGSYATNIISDEEAAAYEPQEGSYYYNDAPQGNDDGSAGNTDVTGGSTGNTDGTGGSSVPESGENSSGTGGNTEYPESEAAGGTSDQLSGAVQ